VIQLPERAVTRFFVPLIDVLILLFCIFLLLPFVSAPADGTTAAGPTDLDTLRSELRKAKDDLAIEKRRTDELMKERADSPQRTAVWTIDIDGETGELSYAAPDGPIGERFVITDNEKELREKNRIRPTDFILNSKKRNRAVKYVFVCPRKASRFPDKPTLDNIAAWFANESYFIDNPFAPR
jgi:hypothetical protein